MYLYCVSDFAKKMVLVLVRVVPVMTGFMNVVLGGYGV